MIDFDVVVVGAGNAAMCAALAARETGASVAVLERAPEDERGGNTRFTAGAMRVAYDGLDDLLALIEAELRDRIHELERLELQEALPEATAPAAPAGAASHSRTTLAEQRQAVAQSQGWEHGPSRWHNPGSPCSED